MNRSELPSALAEETLSLTEIFIKLYFMNEDIYVENFFENNKKEVLMVPKGTQFISEWKDYSLPRNEHCIVDKGVTGCGYTEYCLTNMDNVVLCSPRKLLLDNKAEQHEKDDNIYYAKNDIEDVDSKEKYLNRLGDHIDHCIFNEKTIKLMVTYDSVHYIVEYLKNIGKLADFIFVIDEFQSIFMDSYFKPEVELNFVDTLQDCPSVVYLSATPMLDKYLLQLDQFKDLHYTIIDWSESGFTEKIHISRKKVNTLGAECTRIIQNYKSNNFPVTINHNKEVVESKEVVFYFNSLSEIIRIVNKNGLTAKNTRIICSDTPDNRAKLKKIDFEPGRVPVKEEKNPMFMFCTSTSYIGVDFYSDCASSFVFADPNIDSLALDISLDLPQIIGRQRSKTNPFKNDIVVFYKTIRHAENTLTYEHFRQKQLERRESTNVVLSEFGNMSERGKKEYSFKLRDSIEVSHYSRDYVSFNREGMPVYNPLIEISNERAWEVSQIEYQDNLTVTKTLERLGLDVGEYQSESEKIVRKFLEEEFFITGIFKRKMRAYCKFRDQYSNNPELLSLLDLFITDPKFSRFYEYYGSNGCGSRRYEEAELLKGWTNVTKQSKLSSEIYSTFSVGDRFSKKDLKIQLQKIYEKLGISKTAKASDLGDYFDLSATKVTMPDKSVVNGFKLGKKD